MNPQDIARPTLAQYLISTGELTPDQLRIARHEQAISRLSLAEQLLALGFSGESAVLSALSHCLGHPFIESIPSHISPEVIALLPEEAARRFGVMPLTWNEAQHELCLAMSKPDDLSAQDGVISHLPQDSQLHILLATRSEIERAQDIGYRHDIDLSPLIGELEQPPAPASKITTEGLSPATRLVDALLSEAVKQNASDIHFEPEAHSLSIRYRIDGLLSTAHTLHHNCWPPLNIRLKILAGMNIAENRAPQDGRFDALIGGRQIDFRVASLPTLHGENIVLRILGREQSIRSLASLSLPQKHLEKIEQILQRPGGMTLFTGPTGSGKTTTLYALLQCLDRRSSNIMTLEDPVEYVLPGIRQSMVNDAAKLGFANGIRAMMRQDPDVILVGEIRDQATAEMAFQAAMTGHQVFATLHTASALGALPRLKDLGIRPGLMAGHLKAIVAQRLLRELCPECKQFAPASAEDKQLLAYPADQPRQIAHPVGCPHCANRGYRGRFALLEILPISSRMDELIADDAPSQQLREQAYKEGFSTLLDDGRASVLSGRTALGEVRRTIDMG